MSLFGLIRVLSKVDHKKLEKTLELAQRIGDRIKPEDIDRFVQLANAVNPDDIKTVLDVVTRLSKEIDPQMVGSIIEMMGMFKK